MRLWTYPCFPFDDVEREVYLWLVRVLRGVLRGLRDDVDVIEESHGVHHVNVALRLAHVVDLAWLDGHVLHDHLRTRFA